MVCAWCVVSGAPKKMTRMKTAGTVRVMVRMSERKAGYTDGQSFLVCVSCNVFKTYHSSSSKVLGRLRLLLPFLLGWWRRLTSRREAEEAVDQLDDNHQRRKPHQRPDRVLHEAIEAQNKARQQDGSVHIGCQEGVVIVEDLDGFGGWQHNRRRF